MTLRGSSNTMRTAFPSSSFAGTPGWHRTGDAGVQWVWSAQLLAVLAASMELVLSSRPYIPFWDKKPNSLCLSLVLALPLLERRELSRYTENLKGLKCSSVKDERKGCLNMMQSFSNVDLEAWPRNIICLLFVFSPPNQVLLLITAQYFASIMVIVGLSVVVTVLVLQFHHHDPQGGKMPKWVSRFDGKYSTAN